MCFGGALFCRNLLSGIKRQCSYSMIFTLNATPELMATIAVRNGVKPVVARVLPLSEVQQAHAELESRRTRGKVVLTLSSTPGE